MSLEESLAEIESLLESQRQFRESASRSMESRMRAASQAGSAAEYMRSLIRAKAMEALADLRRSDPIPSKPEPPSPEAGQVGASYCSCGVKLPPNAKFCSVCGSALAPPKPVVNAQPKCSQCGTITRPGAKFCGRCGAAISSTPASQVIPTCSGCGRLIKPGAKFCGGCGKAISK
jgi:RNA polymerase subunit RPABC4/transcription elongation factor Spt4